MSKREESPVSSSEVLELVARRILERARKLADQTGLPLMEAVYQIVSPEVLRVESDKEIPDDSQLRRTTTILGAWGDDESFQVIFKKGLTAHRVTRFSSRLEAYGASADWVDRGVLPPRKEPIEIPLTTDKIILNEEDSREFIEILSGPPEPSQTLREAAEKSRNPQPETYNSELTTFGQLFTVLASAIPDPQKSFRHSQADRRMILDRFREALRVRIPDLTDRTAIRIPVAQKPSSTILKPQEAAVGSVPEALIQRRDAGQTLGNRVVEREVGVGDSSNQDRTLLVLGRGTRVREVQRVLSPLGIHVVTWGANLTGYRYERIIVCPWWLEDSPSTTSTGRNMMTKWAQDLPARLNREAYEKYQQTPEAVVIYV